MQVSFVRTLILYFFVLLMMRMMGKRQLGELQLSELVVAIMVSDLAAVPMQSPETPLLNGLIPILTLMICEVVLSYIALKSKKVRRVLIGKPSHIIADGKLVEKELQRLRYSVDDLQTQLRIDGYPDISQIKDAFLETNGELSVVPKSLDNGPATRILISDGVLDRELMRELNLSEKWLQTYLKSQRVSDPSQVFLLILNEKAPVFFQKKEQS